MVQGVSVNGHSARCATHATGADTHALCRIALAHSLTIVVRHTRGFAVLLAEPAPQRGERSSALKVLSQRLAGDTLVLQVEGLAGHTYDLPVRTPRGIARVAVVIPSGGDAVDGYSATEVRVPASK